jgi:hypothetical protein
MVQIWLWLVGIALVLCFLGWIKDRLLLVARLRAIQPQQGRRVVLRGDSIWV